MSCLTSPEFGAVLDELYADSAKNDPLIRQTLPKRPQSGSSTLEEFAALKDVYMPVDREFGHLMYGLARAGNAKCVVEFGTSFGISTLFLAAAINDNKGGGRVVTTEFIEAKSLRAQENLKRAGVSSLVDFRIGDAATKLTENLPQQIDFVFLDGAKNLYLDILKVIEPSLKIGAIIAADNTDSEGLSNYLNYVRDGKNGYVSTATLTSNGSRLRHHEISVRI